MAHKRNPETKEIVHHWIVSTDIIHIHEDDEGYYLGVCKVKRCEEVKYFPAYPATTYQSAWMKMKRERLHEERMRVK